MRCCCDRPRPDIVPLISTEAALKIAVPTDSNNRRATCDIRAEPARYPQRREADCGAKALRTSTGSAIAGSIFFVTSSREMRRLKYERRMQ